MFVNGEQVFAHPLAGLSPEASAERFCREHKVFPREPCVSGVAAQLEQLSRWAFQTASLEGLPVGPDGSAHPFHSLPGEDPNTTAWRRCGEIHGVEDDVQQQQ